MPRDFDFPSSFYTRRFSHEDVRTILGAADRLDELEAASQGNELSEADLRNSMGDDLRQMLADDIAEQR